VRLRWSSSGCAGHRAARWSSSGCAGHRLAAAGLPGWWLVNIRGALAFARTLAHTSSIDALAVGSRSGEAVDVIA
jgi:hypothetical protein